MQQVLLPDCWLPDLEQGPSPLGLPMHRQAAFEAHSVPVSVSVSREEVPAVLQLAVPARILESQQRLQPGSLHGRHVPRLEGQARLPLREENANTDPVYYPDRFPIPRTGAELRPVLRRRVLPLVVAGASRLRPARLQARQLHASLA